MPLNRCLNPAGTDIAKINFTNMEMPALLELKTGLDSKKRLKKDVSDNVSEYRAFNKVE